MFQKILVANDGSTDGYLALETAIGMAKKFKAKLEMIICEEFPIYANDVELLAWMDQQHVQSLECIAKSKQIAKSKRINLETYLFQGVPVTTISDFVEKNDVDLLVLGFVKHSAFYRWFVGSTTDGLVEDVPCHVLVVKAIKPEIEEGK